MKNALKLLISSERDEFNREYAKYLKMQAFSYVLLQRRPKSIRFY